LTLAEVIEAAERDGCELNALPDPDGSIYVFWLARRREPPGLGARALQRLCDYADKRKLIIRLDCEGKRLIRYYKRFGFGVEFKVEYPKEGWETDAGMIRYPQ
jgi:ribosomal protein S18 acetylase RimI-like enzyme